MLFCGSLFADEWIEVCIDPGHGGPTAQKYGNNGDYAGAYGYGNNISEQWINLQVSKAFIDTLNWLMIFWDYLPTREDETNITIGDAGLWERANKANYANGSYCSDEFISIHHNGFQDPEANQGTEAFWSDTAFTDSGYSRTEPCHFTQKPAATAWTLAGKLMLYVWGRFNATVSWGWYELRFETPEGGPKKKNFAVLKHTKMPSAISEASDITQEHYPITESYLFDDPPNYSHIQHEGAALFHGWQSYRDNAGFVYIDYVSLFGNNPDDKRVLVDDELVEVPWRTSWNAGSYHWIEANWQTTWSGTTCYFHHWEEKETGITNVARLSNWLIPEESTHTYIAYYTGGPYFVDLFAPIGGEYWTAGDTAWILLDFGSSNGIENSALIDIWLDRSGGSGGYPNRIVQNYPLSQGISIPIAPALPGSNNCKIKVWSRDLAENQAYTYSEQSFYLYLIGDVNQSDNITLGDVIYLVNYVFDKPQGSCQTSDPDPCWPITPLYRGDANGDCNVTLADITYLANYYFGVGPQPVRCPSLPSAKTLAVSK